MALSVVVIAFGVWLGLVAGVAVAGGGISLGHQAALAVHLAFFGFASGALALALAAVTGRKAVAAGGAAAFAVVGFLINGFAPLVDGVELAEVRSRRSTTTRATTRSATGSTSADLAVLGAATAALMVIATLGFRHRDLRA